jgi:ATP-dependent Clp protease ATP-binding subunit ClpC
VAPNTTPQTQQQDHARAARSSALEVFTRDLTMSETAAALDPVIGRDAELERVIQILCRRTKNNPLLLGEPGVGKTAIIEGLAKRLAEGDVPDVLHGKRLLTLDLALTVAGTMYRGEFEARLKQIIDEVREDPNVILFIDEIHTIVGAGSTTGSLDAANILKPALARGDIHCIGATTWMEFKKHIEPDAALERRFQPITVDEPTAEATMEIVRGLAPKYAAYHRVSYTPEALAECVRLSERYLSDRHFPDKAIDLMDEAAARVNAQRRSEERMERLSSLEVAIHAAEEQKEQAVTNQDLTQAQAFHEDVTRLRKEYENLKQAYERARGKDMPKVEARHVAEVVARMASVSLAAIQATDREQITHFAEDLRTHILGQERAVRDIAEVIARSRLGLHDPKRPKAALLLVGPSGTGKTETARFIARHLFGREDALIRIDMSEFAESHTVSKLVGSPAGYVGYREGTKLTDAIRKRPHAVILFDELEKAHGDVQNLLLQILEDGTISDGTGRSVTLRHAYVILTSNVGSERAASKSLGFGNTLNTSPILQEVRDRFKPEFLNRLDRIVVYEPLTTVSMKEIVQRELTTVMERVAAAQHVALHAGDDVLTWLLNRPLPPEEGARAARRLIEQEITSLLSRLLAEKPQKKIVRIRATSQGLKMT